MFNEGDGAAGPAAYVREKGMADKALGPAPAGAEAAPARGRRNLVFTAIIALIVVGGSLYGYRWWMVGRFQVSTDDAYVRADVTLLAAKVTGYVTAVAVENNQEVKAGDVIMRIDDGDYQLAVQSVRDRIAIQEATIGRIGEQKNAALASVDQAKAQIAAAKADFTRASLELDRQKKLAQSDYASKAKVETTSADRDRAAANLTGTEAALASVEANVAVLEGQRHEAERMLTSNRTELAKAERDLSFTVVKAPVGGIVGNRAVQVGQFVQPGVRLAAIVPLESVYIDANFKETQLSRLKPGQRVRIFVDAYPDEDIEGVVESVSPASGAMFSMLPPENATGNFTKIVQRVPVRLSVSSAVARAGLLRPGMSVVATVDTRQDHAVTAQR